MTQPVTPATPQPSSSAQPSNAQPGNTVQATSAHQASSAPRPSRAARPAARRRKRVVVATFVVSIALLLVAILLSTVLGQLVIPPDQVLGSVLRKVGITWLPGPTHQFGEDALWNVRFPRIALALIVGSALAVAGVVMQGIFGNPLAEPGTVGVSSGAAVGASLAIVTGWSFFGVFTVPVLAFVTGLLTTMLVYLFARKNGRTEVVTLILMGIAVNALAGAIISFIVFMAPTSAREEIVFWQLGSLNGSRWQQVGLVLPLFVIGTIGALILARKLDLLALGERSARHLGVDVERLRLIAMVLVALLVSAAVAFAGIISFVGLVIPHLLRLIVGPGHRLLVPLSVIGGATLLLFADLAARTLITSADLPIGMLTALIGGPFFFWLLRRSRDKSGGWA